MIDQIITYSFYLLFFLTPLFWTSQNYELFEFNKMILTYGFTVIIVGCWLLKIINRKSLIFNRTPLDIPLLLFLGANILSTIFSMDPHTSIWGYYSRSNGGLLSLISYLLLYWAFVSHMDKDKVLTTLKFGLTSGFIIAIWAILEHFGISFSCVILRGEFNNSCWIQDVQTRVFASLGQPNWLATYLAMLIFPALYFLITSENTKERITYFISLITMYLAFTFTYSRGPTLGLIGGLAVFLILSFPRRRESNSYCDFFNWIPLFRGMTKSILVIIGTFLIINLLFGSALTSFRLVSKFAVPVRPGISLPASSGTQLENGGTESGQIRFIVWQGALDIFKHYPIFGSGLETFAYSYYQYRPVSHNLTSEWDFLYNKAHNEYLNYLATTGIVGFGTYLLIIGTFIVWSIKKILKPIVIARTLNLIQGTKQSNQEIASLIARNDVVLLISVLASYISYLIYNFFLFSVVIIAIFFYLFPALVFVASDSTSTFKLPSSKHHLLSFIIHFLNLIYRQKIYTNIARGIVILSAFYFLYSTFQLWYGDTVFNQGEKALDSGNAGKAYNLLNLATDLNPNEPFYKSELAYSAAASAAALQETNATLSAGLKDEALIQLSSTFRISPKNVSFWRTAVRTYFELSNLDKKYVDETLKALDTTIKLAPTDPKLYYNKALILEAQGKKDQEIQTLQQTLRLKPNYLEAKVSLEEATKSGKTQ